MPKNFKKQKLILSGNPVELKNQIKDFNTNKNQKEILYETNLDRLEKEFPEISFDIIEEIYEECGRTYLPTKKKLEEICGQKPCDSLVDKNIANNSKSTKDTDTNYIDDYDKLSSNQDKPKNETSNELSRHISSSFSNNSGNNNNFYSESCFFNESPNTLVTDKNKSLNNDYININSNLNNNVDNPKVKKFGKKNKNKAYDISELINTQNDLFRQRSDGNSDKTNKNLIAFKLEDNFLSSDEEERLNNEKNKNKKNRNLKNKNNREFNNSSHLINTNNNFPKNGLNGKNKNPCNFEYYQNNNTGKKVNPEEMIYNYLTVQKKGIDQYTSVFDENILKEKPKLGISNCNLTNDIGMEMDIYYFEELLLDYYIKIISEFFPQLTSTEIMEKICDFDFNIDELIINLLDTNKETHPGELNKLENNDISIDIKNEVFKNFYFEENENYEYLIEHNLQQQIEKEIKKNNNCKNSNNTITIKNKNISLPDLIPLNITEKKEEKEEDFLNKPINEIETKSIREDLIKLKKNLPLVDEFEIKWVYYQYMDYDKTLCHFSKQLNFGKPQLMRILEKSENAEKFKTKNNQINSNPTTLFDKKNKNCINGSQTSSNNSKKLLSNSSNNSQFTDTSMTNNLYKIMTEVPKNWTFESYQDFSLNEYQEIRQKLIYQAQLAWRSGRHQDAMVIMAKARRYKEEVNSLLKNKKLENFLKNNQSNSILNMINKRENFIDVHGLTYEEAKILINKKINDIKNKKNNGFLDESKSFCLSIITGVGNHSVGNRPVLLPNLSNHFNNLNYRQKVDYKLGIIKIFI